MVIFFVNIFFCLCFDREFWFFIELESYIFLIVLKLKILILVCLILEVYVDCVVDYNKN